MSRFTDGRLWTFGMTIGYALAITRVLPALSFFPRLGAWGWHAIPDEPAISWYGHLMFAFLGGAACGVIGGWAGLKLPWRLALAAPMVALAFLIWGQRRWF